jgi:hypothetical protein
VVVSHPFAEGAKGWGTRDFASGGRRLWRDGVFGVELRHPHPSREAVKDGAPGGDCASGEPRLRRKKVLGWSCGIPPFTMRP